MEYNRNDFWGRWQWVLEVKSWVGRATGTVGKWVPTETVGTSGK